MTELVLDAEHPASNVQENLAIVKFICCWSVHSRNLASQMFAEMDASHAAVGPVNSQEGDNTMQLFPNLVLQGVDQLADRLVDLNKTPLNSFEVPAAPLAPVMQHAPGSSAQGFIFGAHMTATTPSVNAASDDGHSGFYEATSSRRGAKKAGLTPGHICKRAADMQRDLKRLKRENKLLKKELNEARAAADSTGDDDEESTL